MAKPKPLMFSPKRAARWSEVLFVDTGLHGTGLALFPRIWRPCRTPVGPSKVEVLRSGFNDWRAKVREIADFFRQVIETNDVGAVVLEFQELWGGSADSYASAASGNLFKLTFLTGVLGGIAEGEYGCEVILVKPGQWKGQLSKTATRRRIKRALGNSKRFPEHAEDAVGMGLSAQGKL